MDTFESQLLALTTDEDDDLNQSNDDRTNPYATPRSIGEQQALDANKADGLIPNGRKTSGKTVTDLDARTILEPLSVFRAMTADQISILSAPEKLALNKGRANLHNPRSVRNRLNLLRKAGLVESSFADAGRTLYGVSRRGRAAALRFDRIEYADQINESGVHGIKTEHLAHLEAVNWVAAQAMSPETYPWQEGLRLPYKELPLRLLRTEHQIAKEWDAIKRGLREQVRRNPDGPRMNFRDWRVKTLTDARARALNGEIQWNQLMRWYPGLWTLANYPEALNQDTNQHHLPDLVIDLEDFRKSDKRLSIAIEVELNAKQLPAYEKQFAMWRNELSYVDKFKGATTFAKLIYFTNSPTVVKALKTVASDLIEMKYLEIHPLTGRDGVTPLSLSNRT